MIRHATIADADRLVTLAQHFVEGTIYKQIIPLADPDRLMSIVLTVLDTGVFLVGPEGAELQGMLALNIGVDPFSGSLVADELCWWVEPSHRKTRLGYYLLRSAEAWARQNRLTMLKMVAPAGNFSVSDYYVKHGFLAVESSFLKILSTTE